MVQAPRWQFQWPRRPYPNPCQLVALRISCKQPENRLAHVVDHCVRACLQTGRQRYRLQNSTPGGIGCNPQIGSAKIDADGKKLRIFRSHFKSPSLLKSDRGIYKSSNFCGNLRCENPRCVTR